MDKKPRLFIYDRKEMGVLLLLILLIAVFAFTLGVHLGKQVGVPATHLDEVASVTSAATEPDSVPNRQDLTEQAPGAVPAADETLAREMHKEVVATGIRLDTPRPVELPSNSKSLARTDTSAKPVHDEMSESSVPAAKRGSPAGKFTLQIGSHQKLLEAKDQIEALETLGLRPFLRGVDLKTKGKWFRVYLGGYQTRDEAEKAGARFRAQQMIQSFIVAKKDS